MTPTPAPHPHPKCRVNWQKPNRNWTICNYVDEVTNECKQTDWKRCPCGGIVRTPLFDRIPYKESERRVDATHTSAPAPSNTCEENGCTDIENCDEICQHSRLFSPLQMQEAKEQAAKAAREQVLSLMGDYLAEHIYNCRGISCVDSIKMAAYIGSLRQQEPQQ